MFGFLAHNHAHGSLSIITISPTSLVKYQILNKLNRLFTTYSKPYNLEGTTPKYLLLVWIFCKTAGVAVLSIHLIQTLFTRQ